MSGSKGIAQERVIMSISAFGESKPGSSNPSGVDVTGRPDVDKLHGKAIGLLGVLLLTVTGAAPLTTMLLNVPIIVGSGNGFGAPAPFLFAMSVLLVFSVGYAAMCRKVSAVGGFYSFISHGLGRELGMAAGLASIVAYSVFEASLEGGFAYFACDKLHTWGMDIPWPLPALVMALGISILTYFDVTLSAGILGAALVAEVAVLAIFDIGVFSHAGDGAVVDASALNPMLAFQGFDSPGPGLSAGFASIGIFFAFGGWVGFEMAPNYAEESRDPKRIIPLSLYVSVSMLGLVYIVTAWAALSGYETATEAITMGQTDAANFFFKPATRFVGAWLATLMSYLILTSCFACGMAFHNTAARYLYALGRERVLPSALGKTHRTYKTPYVASIVQSVIAMLIIITFAVLLGTDNPGAQANAGLYVLMALFAVILILIVQALVSLAIAVYFHIECPEDRHWWRTLVAPIFAFAAQVYVSWLLIDNLAFLSGGSTFAMWLAPMAIGIVATGVVLALYLKKWQPETYGLIGRMIYNDHPEANQASPAS